MRFRLAWTLMALAPIALSTPARADERDACFEASSRGQKLKMDRKLKDARGQLMLCARSECPNTVRLDCAGWMNEVLSALPSVVIGARDAKGHDIVQVKVSIDGVATTDHLEGKAIDVDPGVHTFRYEAAGFAAVDEQVVVREGEKNRAITITFGGSIEKDPKPGPDPRPVDRDRDRDRDRASQPIQQPSSAPVAAYVLGGAGLIAAGVGAYLLLHSNGRADDLKNGCGATKSCTQDQVSSVESERTTGAVVGGIGVAAIGVAIVLLVTHSSGPKSSGAPTITPTMGASGGGFTLRF